MKEAITIYPKELNDDDVINDVLNRIATLESKELINDIIRSLNDFNSKNSHSASIKLDLFNGHIVQVELAPAK